MQHSIQQSQMPQGLAGKRAGKARIAGLKTLQPFQLEIQRSALAQYARDNGKRGAPCGKAGVSHEECLGYL